MEKIVDLPFDYDYEVHLYFKDGYKEFLRVSERQILKRDLKGIVVSTIDAVYSTDQYILRKANKNV